MEQMLVSFLGCVTHIFGFLSRTLWFECPVHQVPGERD